MGKRILSVLASVLVFLGIATDGHAETVTATCYSPQGKRFWFVDGEEHEGADGYSNSNPTFIFTSSDPTVLVESWQAALPFPELIEREQVDAIVPPSASKSAVVFRSDSVIHAVSLGGRDAYATTLYLKEGKGVFFRIRVDRINDGGAGSGPMAALYTANCNFNVLE